MRIDSYADAPRLPQPAQLESIDLRTVVGSGEEPVELELGPGRGWFLIDRLRAVPDVRMVGLEIRKKWASIVDRRLGQFGLTSRGRVFAEDARDILPRLRAGTVSRVFIHFPDPWWKKKHSKRLLICPPVIAEIGRVLVPGGELYVQTDVLDRAEVYQALIEACEYFEPWGETARVDENPHGTRSPRERGAVKDELPVARLRYRRRSALGEHAPALLPSPT